ncbi:MAG: CBS domain-containing protein [Anaerolineaceae bacterium]
MRLVLTHEQADLDALASLLGAHLLDEGSFALLPRQINRNGLSYVKHFGTELGFSQITDLPAEPICNITLVDTQSLITLKGLTPKTRIHVIDHHPRKAHTNPDWEVDLHTTGACTTLLVEKIREVEIPLSSSQATLMILGIYEDTGSLSYASTTTRDLLAAAYLLEHGADLNNASRYLNPPLSNAQVLLYDRLLKDMTTHTIENHTILVAKASALDIHDEISTVAHKMREFMNPDGLVLLVSTRQGIRLVARSTSDEVDMAQLARYFGGGGHKRAASALIRTETRPTPNEMPAQWRKIFQQVVALLPEIVHPSVRVRQIMSRKPLLLSPDTPVETVADLMKRYGFEGYPVIENGKVVGLLTRRNVDRALSHKISANAGNLMDAGSVSVIPQDTLDHLQEVMASSGWGQVPVIDPENGEVIGIVTRTDLISTHSGFNHSPSQEELTRMLNNAIPYPRQILLQTIALEATKQNVQAYIVGGFVRDLLLKQPSQDFDIVIEGDAIEFVNHLVEVYGGRAVTHHRFGTAKWVISEVREQVAEKLKPDHPLDPQALPEHLDLITARTEFYEKPAALPTVESSSIKMDLHRRDFSINTLALRLDGPYYGKLYDFWGGYHDLQNGLIRVLHALSFVDDATRILRGVRFIARFDFKFEPRTLSLLEASLPLLKELTGSRLRHELDLMLMEPKISQILRYLEAMSVLEAIHPSLPCDAEAEKRMEFLYSPVAQAEWKTESNEGQFNLRQVLGYCYWLEILPTHELELVAARLRIPVRVVHHISQTAELRRNLPQLVDKLPSQIVQRLDLVSPVAITAVYQSTLDESQRNVLQAYMTRYRSAKPITTGDDLRARGLPPSPQYQKILQALRTAWLDGQINSAKEEQSLLDALLKAI